MGATHNPNLKSGIKINGIDSFDIHPDNVKEIINSDKTGIVRAVFQDKLNDINEELLGRPIPNDYAKHAGRPSIKELPFGKSENDGYPFLTGHSPQCDGKKTYPNPSHPVYAQGSAKKVCWCSWIGYKK